MRKDRPYQIEAADAVYREFEDHRSTLIVMATGCGKSRVLSSVVKRWTRPGRVLVLAHRDELITQNARELRNTCIDDNVEIEHAGSGMLATRGNHQSMWGGSGRIVVASKDTICKDRALRSFAKDEFSLIVTDEAHHATASTYQKIYDYFPEAKHLGMTATADRTDGRAMGEVFESVAYVYDILTAINQGWLVRPVQQYITVQDYDLSQIKINRRTNDFDDDDLDKFLLQEKILHGMVIPMMELANFGGQRRPVLLFANSVEQAKALSHTINAKQPGSSAYIDCKSVDNDQRRFILQEYRDGRIQYLANYGILTEGTDLPRTRCVFMSRPMRSRLLYAQCLGRGLRPIDTIADALNDLETDDERKALIKASEKPGCLVIDTVGVSGQHKLICGAADILGGWYADEIVEMAKEKAAARGGRGDVAKDLEDAQQEFNQLQERRKVNLKIGVQYTSRLVDPFDPTDLQKMPEPKWATGKKPTEPQIEYLRNMGLSEKELPSTLWDVKQLLDKLVARRKAGLCTWKQAKTLKRLGVDPEKMTFKEASDTIDRAAKNGWQL